MIGERNELDTVFALLADRRRRHLLYYLTRESGTGSVDVDELVSAVAEREQADADVDAAGVDVLRRRVELSLHHVHLPKLEGAGVVRFSEDAGRVELEDLGVLTPFIDWAARREDVDEARQEY
jgi:hypothetical protein